jgi:Trypsin-like peptidase domain
MPIDIATELVVIERLARDGSTERLHVALEPIREAIERGDLALDELQAFRLIDILTIAGMPDLAAGVAESLSRQGKSWTFLVRAFGHALIERRQFGAALGIFKQLESMSGLTRFEAASCQGHLGRLFKSLEGTPEVKRNAGAAREARGNSIRHYREAYRLSNAPDPGETLADRAVDRHIYRVWLWAATNLLTMLHDVDNESRPLTALAREIIAGICARPLKSYFDHSALGAAHFVLAGPESTDRHIVDGVAEFQKMLDHPAVSLGQIERTLREFTEQRQALTKKYVVASELKLSLESTLLQRRKGVVVITGAERKHLLEDYQRLAPGDDARLNPHIYAVRWLKDGIHEAASIARIERKNGSLEGAGSGFILSGEHLCLDPGLRLLVTCAHVLSSSGGADSIGIRDAAVRFELMGDKRYTVKQILFESLPGHGLGLDATIAVLEEDISHIHPLPLSSGAASNVREQASEVDISGGYTIGHPLGTELSITLGPAEFTERFTAYNRSRDAMFLRYTTETMGGNSGGPIFDTHWNVVALHQQGVVAGGEKAGQGLIVASLLDIARKHIGYP